MKINYLCPFLGAFICFLLSCSNDNNKTSYKLSGHLTGVKGKGVAILQDYQTYKEDTVPFIDGKFEFTGEQEIPKIYRLYFIGPEDSLVTQCKSDLLYIENGDIHCSGEYYQLMNYIENNDPSLKRMTIKGGNTNAIYESYLNDIRPIMQEAIVVSNKLEYPGVAVENMTEEQYSEALQMQEQLDFLLSKRDSIKDKCIETYANSQLAYDFVLASIAKDRHYEEWIDENRAHGNGYPEDIAIPSTDKVEKWISLLNKQNTFSPNQIDTLRQLADKCSHLTPGAPFIDGYITTLSGDSVLLSSQLKEGQYTLIDCWASWCHPCRASIPHLKQLYKKYKDKGLNVIGLSLDGNQMKDQWLKAVDAEQMDWPQFLTDFHCEIIKDYSVAAIPNILLITPDKKILKTGVRGFDLDLILKNIYGN